MIDRATTKIPVSDFALPPHAPAPVGKAIAQFERVTAEWRAARGAIAEATAEAEQARAVAKQAAIDSAVSRKKPARPGVGEIEAEYAAKLAALGETEETLRLALDQVGNELATTVASHRDEWLARMIEVRTESAQTYAEKLGETRAALSELAAARGAVEYLSTFDHSRAQVGAQRQFSGGRLTVIARVPGVLQKEWDPAALLDAAAKVTDS
jgi:hypothetical protein